MNSDKIYQKLKDLENKIDNISQSRSIPLWLTLEQTANYLNIGESTIRRLVSDNDMPFSGQAPLTSCCLTAKRLICGY